MKTVKVMLDRTLLSEKPQGAAIGAVQKRLANGGQEVSIGELATLLASGATFKPAYLNGTTNDTWESQSVFALDFDNGYTFVEAMEKCQAFGIAPTFAYTSFSDGVDKDGTGAKERFRLIFVTETVVTDARLRNAVQIALMTVFNECDEACKDATRLFFGGRKLLYLDETATIDAAELIAEVLPSALKAYDENNNYPRLIKNYCQQVGLNMVNGLPAVVISELEEDDLFGDAKIDENAASSIIYYRECHDLVKKCTFSFNITDTANFKVGRGGKLTIKKVAVDSEKAEAELIRNLDFEALEENCRFYQEFVNGEFWPTYEQVKGLATNLCTVKGGFKRATEALALYEDQYPNKYSYINAQNCITNMNKYNYAPMRCQSFDCPYYNDCNNDSVNMIGSAMKSTKQNIVELKDETTYSDLDEAYQDAVDAMHAYLTKEQTEGKSMLMLIGPTGVGKTTMLRDLQTVYDVDFSNTIICLPTHNTVADVFPRVSQDNYIVAAPLELEDEALMAKYNALRKIGHYGLAKKVIQDIYLTLEDSKEVMERKQRDANRVEKFLETERELTTTSKTIFCTHKKALHLNNQNVDTLIVDEDILMSGLFEQVALNEQEIMKAKEIAQEAETPIIAAAMQMLLDKMQEAKMFPMHIMTLGAKSIGDKEIKSFMTHAVDRIDFDVRRYLAVTQLVADKNAICVTGSYKVELPYKKVIVMSATASPEVYKAFLPTTQIEVHDMGNIRTAGRIIHHHVGTSRQAMKTKGERLIEKIKKEAAGVTNIISFKEQEKALTKAGFNFICNFGNCTGIDAYKGQDLIVVGTPHVNQITYLLLAATIKPNINIIQDFEMTEIKKNGFKFQFNTFKDIKTETGSLLHSLQMYYIETELIQAVGRARALRENCTVHVFSNLPIRGSQLYR